MHGLPQGSLLGVDPRQPTVRVGNHAVDHVEKGALQRFGNRAAAALADRDLVNRLDRRDLGGGSDKEDLVGKVEELARHVGFDHLEGQIAGQVKKAYESARKIYDELLGDRGTTGMAMRVARDKDLQKELRKTVEELRLAGRQARGGESHVGRNVSLLLVGIALGVLFNPATGPDTRRWLKDKLLGPEEPFQYESSKTNGS